MKKSCVLLLLTFPLMLLAQATVQGTIIDAQGPVIYANVLLLSPDSTLIRGVITNELGEYEITGIPDGEYRLAADALGYGPVYSSSFVLQDKQLYRAALPRLSPIAANLSTVTVSARKPLFEQRLDRMVVNVQQSVTNAGATALEVLERSPGVTVDRVNELIRLQGKAGVIVMINGKANRLDEASIIQMLSGMPAANIEKIEIIPVPPANYEAEGSAGLIDIILLQTEDEGWNASWTSFAGYSERLKWGSTINLFMRKGKWNWQFNFGTNSNYTNQDVRVARSNMIDGNFLETSLYSQRPAYIGFHNARIGVDYQLNSRTSIGFLLAGHISEWELDAQTESTVVENGVLQEQSDLSSFEINDWQHGLASVNLQHKFQNDNQLSLTIDYLDYLDQNPTDYLELLTTPEADRLEQRFRSNKETPVQFWVAALDYEHAGADWQWQAGVKTTFSRFVNKVGLENLDGDIWYSDKNFSDWFTLNEDILASYWSVNRNWEEGWQLKAGLRYEWLDSRRLSRRDGLLPGQRYGRVFPSVFISKAVGEDQQWSVAYAERITRPSFNVLAPAFFFFSPNSILAGNPAVRQIITRQLNLSYRYKTLNLNFSLSDDTDPIAWGQPFIDEATNVAVIRAENMADQKTAGLQLTLPITILPWWESRTQGGVYWRSQAPIVEGEQIRSDAMYYSINTSQNFSLPAQWTGGVDFRYNGRRPYGLGFIPARYALDLAIQKQFKEGKHRLSLNWTDVFRTSNFWAIEIDQPDLDLKYDWRYFIEAGIVRLTYTRQFGNNGKLEGRQGKGASAEEQGRVN